MFKMARIGCVCFKSVIFRLPYRVSDLHRDRLFMVCIDNLMRQRGFFSDGETGNLRNELQCTVVLGGVKNIFVLSMPKIWSKIEAYFIGEV